MELSVSNQPNGVCNQSKVFPIKKCFQSTKGVSNQLKGVKVRNLHLPVGMVFECRTNGRFDM